MTDGNNRVELEQQIIERASRDAQFRKDFTSNPRQTVERELGVSIPEGISITVVEETPAKVYVVLPPAPVQAGQEISDADLEAVAGGWSANTECGTCGAATCNTCGHYCYPT